MRSISTDCRTGSCPAGAHFLHHAGVMKAHRWQRSEMHPERTEKIKMDENEVKNDTADGMQNPSPEMSDEKTPADGAVT